MENKAQKGAVLMATLMINGVISLLVLANMNAQILLMKASQTSQVKSDRDYELKAVSKHFIETNDVSKMACLYQTKPHYLYPPLNSPSPWCLINKGYYYKIWDGGANCCLKTSPQGYAHLYYVQFKNKKEQRLQATVAIEEVNEACHCLNASGITKGIINVREE